ncbi:hypothetical protein GIY23_09110 [Allosaccharopolyspora coralli]|uniref:Uncharacterized protein n=1 Tax=Allosaccharopolyspora coralli TaxID=2665642 RepID=A0A5Q3Q8W9_9PSEU|nr:hypothetical protein [Allosaccharopolyspora coralli]QGK69654.1 hypothetical protein GIY23_09110 [Allosaccharopolyspora coralli]
MRRLFWFGAGAAAGIAAYRKVNETTRKATPSGMAEHLGGAVRELAGAVGSFGAEVRAGMTERERELHEVVERTTEPTRQQSRTVEATGWSADRNAANTGAGAPARRARGAGR